MRFTIFTALTLILLIPLSGCSKADREDSLENTIALFVANGMKRTPALDDAITETFYNVTTYSQLKAELTSLQKMMENYKRNCQTENRTKEELTKLKNKATALQIIAFQHNWPIEARYRFKVGELSCS